VPFDGRFCCSCYYWRTSVPVSCGILRLPFSLRQQWLDLRHAGMPVSFPGSCFELTIRQPYHLDHYLRNPRLGQHSGQKSYSRCFSTHVRAPWTPADAISGLSLKAGGYSNQKGQLSFPSPMHLIDSELIWGIDTRLPSPKASCFPPMPFPYHAKVVAQTLDVRELKFELQDLFPCPKRVCRDDAREVGLILHH